MDENPYKSPQHSGYGEPAGAGGGPLMQDAATQLLTEIRDLQRESLALTREAVARQRRLGRILMVVMAILLLALVVVAANLLYALSTMPPPRPMSVAPSGPAALP